MNTRMTPEDVDEMLGDFLHEKPPRSLLSQRFLRIAKRLAILEVALVIFGAIFIFDRPVPLNIDVVYVDGYFTGYKVTNRNRFGLGEVELTLDGRYRANVGLLEPGQSSSVLPFHAFRTAFGDTALMPADGFSTMEVRCRTPDGDGYVKIDLHASKK